MLKRIVSLLLIITIITMLSFNALCFDIVLTPTIGALLILSTFVVGAGIAISNNEDMQSVLAAGWQNADNTLRNVVGKIYDFFDGSPEGQTYELEKEDIQPIKDWVAQEYPSSSITTYDVGFESQYIENVSLVTSDDLITEISIPKSIAEYTYYLTPECNISYNLTSSNMQVNLKFKDGTILRQTYTGVYADPWLNGTLQICRPVVDSSQKIYFPFWYTVTENNNYIKGFSSSSWYYVNSQGNAYILSLNGGRVSYYTSTYQYLSPSGVTYTSVSKWVNDYLQNGSSIPINIESGVYDSVMELPADGTKTVTLNIPTDLTAAVSSSPSDVLSTDDNIPVDVPITDEQTFWDTIVSKVGAIPTAITNVISAVNSIPNLISIELDKIFNPNSPYLPPNNSNLPDLLYEKFEFMQEFEDSFKDLDVSTNKLEIKANIFGQELVVVSSEWFEPFRLYIRGGLMALFWVLTGLACFRNISSVFGMGVNSAAGIGYVHSGGVTGLRRGNR